MISFDKNLKEYIFRIAFNFSNKSFSFTSCSPLEMKRNITQNNTKKYKPTKKLKLRRKFSDIKPIDHVYFQDNSPNCDHDNIDQDDSQKNHRQPIKNLVILSKINNISTVQAKKYQ